MEGLLHALMVLVWVVIGILALPVAILVAGGIVVGIVAAFAWCQMQWWDWCDRRRKRGGK